MKREGEGTDHQPSSVRLGAGNRASQIMSPSSARARPRVSIRGISICSIRIRPGSMIKRTAAKNGTGIDPGKHNILSGNDGQTLRLTLLSISGRWLRRAITANTGLGSRSQTAAARRARRHGDPGAGTRGAGQEPAPGRFFRLEEEPRTSRPLCRSTAGMRLSHEDGQSTNRRLLLRTRRNTSKRHQRHRVGPSGQARGRFRPRPDGKKRAGHREFTTFHALLKGAASREDDHRAG